VTVNRSRTIAGFLDSELEGLLRSLGLWSEMEAGNLTCSACGDPVTKGSLGGMYFRDGKPHIICNKASCYLDALDFLGKDS
jgi:hypothetical protein